MQIFLQTWPPEPIRNRSSTCMWIAATIFICRAIFRAIHYQCLRKFHFECKIIFSVVRKTFIRHINLSVCVRVATMYMYDEQALLCCVVLLKSTLFLYYVTFVCRWFRVSDSKALYPVSSSHRVIPSQTLLLIKNADERADGRWVSSIRFSQCVYIGQT